MKTLLKILGGLVVVIIIGVGALMAVGSARLAGDVDVSAHPAPAPATEPTSLDEGRRLADALSCTTCHGPELQGADFMDGGPFMRLPAPSLRGDRLSAEQFERAVRHGIGSNGEALIIMPSDAYAEMADDDLAALVGYAASLPPLDATTLERSVGPIGRAVAAFQASELQPARRVEHATTHPGATAGTVSRFGGLCTMCHGADYGGQVFTAEQSYWAPNLTSHPTGASSWTLEEFGTALREGLAPDGRTLDPNEMPWGGFSKLTDAEVEELWQYLRSLPPVDRPRPPEFAIVP